MSELDRVRACGSLLRRWGGYIQAAAQQGALTRRQLNLHMQGIAGPRAGALEIWAGAQTPALMRALGRQQGALMRQFVPWDASGEPCMFLRGRYLRLEAGWPPELTEGMVTLDSLPPYPKGKGRWVVGKNEMSQTVVTGLNDRTPHHLIAGQTGSGKTVALRGAVCQLAQENDVVLVDGKMGEGLGCLQHLSVGPLAIELADARAALHWVSERMLKRYRSGWKSEDGARKIIVVVDEFQEWAGDGVFIDLMRRIAAQGRAAGVHLLAATQHPTVSAFGDATVRRNLTGRIALSVGDADASRVALGAATPRADALLGAGDAYAVAPGAVHRVQVAYVGEKVESYSRNCGERLAEWPAPETDVLSSLDQVPDRRVAFGVEEQVASLVSALEDEGRPSMMSRLAHVGSRPGAERAIRLLEWGRRVVRGLREHGYELCQEESLLRLSEPVCLSGNEGEAV